MEIGVVFVEPESEDNIGALARVMANFGFKKLIIVNPKAPVFSEKVKIVAREKGWEIIKNCEILDDLDEAISKFDITFGTTGIASKKPSDLLRNPLTPEEFGREIWKYKGKVGIFFGRESIGFTNKELDRFDGIITVPASEEYPVMNITHAAAIVFYEIFKNKENTIRRTFRLINNSERYYLIKTFRDFIKVLPIQNYKKPIILRAFRNFIGKCLITKREYSILLGIIKLIERELKNRKVFK